MTWSWCQNQGPGLDTRMLASTLTYIEQPPCWLGVDLWWLVGGFFDLFRSLVRGGDIFKFFTLSRIRLYIFILYFVMTLNVLLFVWQVFFIAYTFLINQGLYLSQSLFYFGNLESKLWFALFSIRVSMKFNSEPVTNASPIGFSPPLVSWKLHLRNC